MKKGKRLLCGALALLLVLSLTAVGTVQRAYATKSEEDQAAEEQKKAEEAAQRQAEMDELERKKQEKKDAAMRAALEIGDQVVTIGGIVGRVVAIKDDTFVLEPGADRVKIRFTKNAISSVEKLNMDKAPADKK